MNCLSFERTISLSVHNEKLSGKVDRIASCLCRVLGNDTHDSTCKKYGQKMSHSLSSSMHKVKNAFWQIGCYYR